MEELFILPGHVERVTRLTHAIPFTCKDGLVPGPVICALGPDQVRSSFRRPMTPGARVSGGAGDSPNRATRIT